MSRIFVSYRRSDVPDMVGRIYDNLTRSFRRHEVFKDVDSIHYGTDFRIVVRQALDRCQIVLVAIGPNWLNVQDEQAKRRLDDPGDFVRLELESAFERGAVVIPLLIGGAEMPSPHALPESLRPLAYLQALPIRRDPDFVGDFYRLQREINRVLSTGTRRGIALGGAAAAVVMALGVTLWWFGVWTSAKQFPAQQAQTAPPAPQQAPAGPAATNPTSLVEQPSDRERATAAATDAMTLLARNDFGALWDTRTSNWFKQRVNNNREFFVANLTMARAQAGSLKSTKVTGSTFLTNEPSIGYIGKIYIVMFANSYEIGNFYEQIVLIEENGEFLVSGIPPAVRTP